MATEIGKLTGKMVSEICDHLGVDLEDLEDLTSVTVPATIAEIEKEWHEFSLDLSHLSREEKSQVLQRSKPFVAQQIDGCEVRLYNDVQAMRGQQRKKAVVIDLGTERFIQAY